LLGVIELQENVSENYFDKLVETNHGYINIYYQQTQEQADKSFGLAMFASKSGLAIVALGIVLMYFDKMPSAYLTTSAGILSEFVAAIFYYLYNRTILKMSQYHQKLLLTQNISLALKISDEMPIEAKAKIQETIIDRLTFDINKFLSA
jgi:hypothetical protein